LLYSTVNSVAGPNAIHSVIMGQFDWFRSIGATPEAVAVLNDQPFLFTVLLIVLVAIILQCVLLWYIHFATLKPEQKKKKEPKKGGAKKPPTKK
jgi:hypothetical protein